MQLHNKTHNNYTFDINEAGKIAWEGQRVKLNKRETKCGYKGRKGVAKEKKDEAVGERKHLFETLTQATLMAAARLFLCPAVVRPPQVILVQVIQPHTV